MYINGENKPMPTFKSHACSMPFIACFTLQSLGGATKGTCYCRPMPRAGSTQAKPSQADAAGQANALPNVLALDKRAPRGM